MSTPIIWPSPGPSLVNNAAGSEPDPSELLAGVRALATSDALVDRGLLSGRVASGPATKRWYEPLFAGGGLDAWLLWWACGGDIDLHDHGGAAGAIYVVEGTLLETHGTRSSRRLRRRALSAGESIAFRPDHIHDIVNAGTEPALSLHVYGPRLEAMTYYRVDDGSGRLLPDRFELVEPRPGVAAASSIE